MKTSLAFSPRHIWNLAKNLVEDVRPIRPAIELFAQGQSFEDFLLLEDSFEWPFMGIEENFTVFLMKDGALGVGLWLTPIAAEMLTENELAQRLETFADMLSKIKNPHVSLQIVFDAEPDSLETTQLEISKDNSFAQKIARKRFEFLSTFAHTPKFSLRLMRRRILFTLRVSGEHPLKETESLRSREQETTEKNFMARIGALRDVLTHIKAGVIASSFKLNILKTEECLQFFRDSLHSFEIRKTSASRHNSPAKSNAPISSQVLYHNVHLTPAGIGLGEGKSSDSWQMASLLGLPEATSYGLMSKLLVIKTPHRIVVNIRPVVKTNDLDSKRYLLKNADDAYGTRQLDDITAAQYRMNREEGLLAFSLHLLVRNEKTALETIDEEGALRGILSEVCPLLGCLMTEETLCAPLAFAACLPFQNSMEVCALVGRETRMLSKNLVSMLPLFGGFQGTKTPMVQMISRGGERINLNPRDSNGASHLAVLGGSGAGKSFSIANMIVAFMASYPKGRVFIIDKKTSYSALAKLASEETENGGARYFNPPHNFPNIFSGVATNSPRNTATSEHIDEDGLPAIVNLLLTAISLLSPRVDISATHTRVLSDALRKTFEEKSRQASNRFDAESGKMVASEKTTVSLPKLSEVVNNLPAACDALQFSPQIANTLAECLSPFIGGGPYAKFFDVEATEETKTCPPLLTLCDLDGVSGDPVLLVLTVQAVILEILRLVKPVQGGTPNPPSLLIIEEVGVLASESPALVSFIRDAWKTMRKFGVTCVGVTNEVADYTEKAGPKEIWNVSPNKLILTQNPSAISEMETKIGEGKNGLVPSLYHCELVRSLKMQKGEFAEAFWMGENTQGTYVYIPAGFDYWCAASDPMELSTLDHVTSSLQSRFPDVARPTFESVSLLAKQYPNGVRRHGELQELNDIEIEDLILKSWHCKQQVSS